MCLFNFRAIDILIITAKQLRIQLIQSHVIHPQFCQLNLLITDSKIQMSEPQQDPITTSIYGQGHWTDEEHLKFVQILMIHGKNIKLLEKAVKTRKTSQIRSHMQKFFKKVKKIHNAKKISQKSRVCLNQTARVELSEQLLRHEITAKTPLEIVRFLRSKPPADTSSNEESQSDSSEQNEEKEIIYSILDCRPCPSFFYRILKWSDGLKKPDQALSDITAFPKHFSKEEEQKVEEQPICEESMIQKAESLNEDLEIVDQL